MAPSQIGWIRHLQLVPSRRLKGKAHFKLFFERSVGRIATALSFRSRPDYA